MQNTSYQDGLLQTVIQSKLFNNQLQNQDQMKPFAKFQALLKHSNFFLTTGNGDILILLWAYDTNILTKKQKICCLCTVYTCIM